MRIIIAGTRSFNNYPLLERVMDKILMKLVNPVILSGACPGIVLKGVHHKGADLLGEQWAFSWWLTVERYHAQWREHGKSAGMIRNAEMVSKADALVAFWDGESAGTKHIITLAKKEQLKTKVIYYEDNAYL